MECTLMVTGCSSTDTQYFDASSAAAPNRFWKCTWIGLLILSSGAWCGCQSTRLGSRNDSAFASQAESEEELTRKSNAGPFSSLFTRWWTTDNQEETEFDLPRAEEDYLNNQRDAVGRLSDRQTSDSPAQRKRKSLADTTSESEKFADGKELTDAQRKLLKRQMDALRGMGLDEQEWDEILNGDKSPGQNTGLADLPPVRRAEPSLPPASSQPLADAAPESAGGASYRFSDSKPPVPASYPANYRTESVAAVPQLPPMQPSPQLPTQPQPIAMQPAQMQSPQLQPQVPPTQLPRPMESLAQPRTPLNAQPSAPNQPGSAATFSDYASTPTNNRLSGDSGVPSLMPLMPVPASSSSVDNSRTSPAYPMGVNQATNTLSPNAPAPEFGNAYYPAGSTTAPVPATTWESDMQLAISKLQDRLLNDKTLADKERRHLEARLRMMYLAADDLNGSLRQIDGWDKEANEWFRHTIMAVNEATNLNGPESINQRFGLVASHEQKANEHLLSLGKLEVKNTAFCTAVESYGKVTKFPKNSFREGQQVILYCEIDNFHAHRVADGYATHFGANYEIVDMAGNRIYEFELPQDEQTCANRRRDYFIGYQFNLPATIAPGSYRLRLNVHDVKANKYAQANVEFQIEK
jgi:hypothetical protein